jgi:hypothetical protein
MQAHEFIFEDDEDYRIPHRAPMHDSGSPLYDVTGTYPDDIYGPNAIQYYGTREPWDSRSIRVIQLSRNKPNQTIQIFRAVPKEVKSNTINPGDWVTASREYATQHGKGLGKYKLLSKIVTAKTLFTNGDSIHEWGYDPGGAAQPVAEGSEQINEYRDRLLQYVKSLLPTWPEYVLKDWLVPNKGDFSNLPADALKNSVMEKVQGAGLTPNSKWQLVPNMKFTMDMFDPKTKEELIGRAGGSSDLGTGIPKDKERHATQAALAQQQGGVRKEPVLLIKTAKGYKLLEGWHRTIQHFAMYPNGYPGPAYVAVAQSNQPVAEGWSQKYKSSINAELNEEFDLIESIIHNLAERNGVDVEAIWEDLDSLTDDELYVFAVTTPVMEDWQKANKQDRTSGMSQKAVNAYRRENPGSKLKTAVTTKPSKLKKGSKASKRRKSYCSRSRGQMKMHSISCAKTPDKAICKARRRWNC